MWRGVNVPVITWIALVLGVWCAAAVGAAATICRVIRSRDRQVPRPPQRPVVTVPSPRRAPESEPGPLADPRPAGRDREVRGSW